MWQFLSVATISADILLFYRRVNFIPLDEIMISLNVRVVNPKKFWRDCVVRGADVTTSVSEVQNCNSDRSISNSHCRIWMSVEEYKVCVDSIHAMKAHGDGDVHPLILNPTVRGSFTIRLRYPRERSSSTLWLGGWVVSGPGLIALVKRRISCFFQYSNHDPSVIQPVA